VGALTGGDGSEALGIGAGFGTEGGVGTGTGSFGTGGEVTVGTETVGVVTDGTETVGVLTDGTETVGVVTGGSFGAVGTVTPGMVTARLTRGRTPNIGCNASARRTMPSPQRAA